MNHRIGKLSLLAVAASLSLTSCSRVSAKTDEAAVTDIPVRAARAVVLDVPVEIAAVGNVEAINSVEIKSRVAGPIAHVAFTEGQNVTRGQLLFTIDREVLNREAASSARWSSVMLPWNNRREPSSPATGQQRNKASQKPKSRSSWDS